MITFCRLRFTPFKSPVFESIRWYYYVVVVMVTTKPICTNRVTETTVRQFEKIFMYGVNELRTDT